MLVSKEGSNYRDVVSFDLLARFRVLVLEVRDGDLHCSGRGGRRNNPVGFEVEKTNFRGGIPKLRHIVGTMIFGVGNRNSRGRSLRRIGGGRGL